jgi:hypothetical protein
MSQPENIVELSIPRPDSSAMIQAQGLLTNAESYAVTSSEHYESAGEFLKHIKAKYRELDEQRKSMTKPLDDSKKRIMDFFAKPLDFLTRAENTIKRAMIAYSDEQERIRREDQRRAEEAARKERERLEAQAQKAAASGKVERAAELEQRAATVVAPIIDRTPPKVSGLSTREVWKFEVIDEKAVPREFLMVDESKLRKFVQTMKGDTAIAGVRVWSEKSLASGAA